ncbi:MAG: hypothetical protein Fur005_20450 [Roseiflexaceae bacterium]
MVRFVRAYLRDLVIGTVLLLTAILAIGIAYTPARSLSLTMATPSAILPAQRFHDLERFPSGAGFFRWTTGQSELRPANPGGPPILSLRLLAGPDGATPLTLSTEMHTFTWQTSPVLRRYHILLPASTGERLTLSLRSPTSEVADRALGVMLADPQIRGQQRPPLLIVGWLGLASVMLYLLLRSIGLPFWQAAMIIMGGQASLALFQFAGGWVNGLAVSLLQLISAGSLGTWLLDRWRTSQQRAAGQPNSMPQRVALAQREWIALVAVVGVALLIRLPWVSAPDPVGDLELAARRMFYLWRDGLAGSYTRGGDYVPLRLIILWGLSQFVRPLGADFFAPLAATTLTIVKLPQLLADLGLVTLIGWWGMRWNRRWGLIAALCYALIPPTWMNSAWWGQVDALLMLPLVAMILLLDRAQGRWSWLLWALALLIKAQAIVFAPILLIATIRLHGARGVVVGGSLAGVVILIGCSLIAAAGQGFGLIEAYLGSVGRFPRTTYGAFNLWHLVLNGTVTEDATPWIGGLSYRSAGFVMIGSIALACAWMLWHAADDRGRIRAAALLALGFFLFPTQIHERYLFLCLPLLALWVAQQPRLLLAFGWYGFAAAYNIVVLLSGFWPQAKDLLEGYPQFSMLIASVNVMLFIILFGWNLTNTYRQCYTETQ